MNNNFLNLYLSYDVTAVNSITLFSFVQFYRLLQFSVLQGGLCA